LTSSQVPSTTFIRIAPIPQPVELIR
jgi:hypothetical protein